MPHITANGVNQHYVLTGPAEAQMAKMIETA